MKTRIAKEFKWEMSHRLTFHQGPCKNIHGHTYKMRVELEGNLDEHGMLLDYYDVESLVQPLLSKLDHGFICDAQDFLMIDFLKTNDFKYTVMLKYTTAENLAKYFMEELLPKVKEYMNVTCFKIRVHETDDVFAEVEIAIV